jgi:hypothetical protein
MMRSRRWSGGPSTAATRSWRDPPRPPRTERGIARRRLRW